MISRPVLRNIKSSTGLQKCINTFIIIIVCEEPIKKG